MTAPVSTTVLVVGTGFGGAVAACRLSQAGFAPLVLERGRRYQASDFPALPSDDGFLPDARRLVWGSQQGFVDVQDLEEILSVQAAGYGGGSLIYANVHLRARPELFEQEVVPAPKPAKPERDVASKERVEPVRAERVWPAAYTREALDPYYDLVASMLDVAPITEHADGPKLVKADQLRRAARALGRESECFHPPLAVSRKTEKNRHGMAQQACVQCGSCCMGCRHGAKNSLDYNYLAIAEAQGAIVKTQCEVLEIERQDGGYRVYYRDHLHGETVPVDAKFVFLCAGVVHTTRLLANPKLGLDPAESETSRIGLGYFPNADAFGVVFDAKHPQYPSFGPTITTATVFRDREICDPNRDAARSWFMLQDGGYAKELARMIGLLRSPLLAGRNLFPRPPANDPDAGRLGASEYAPPVGPRSELGAPALVSPFDGVLDAWLRGAFDLALPKQLARAAPDLRETLSQLLLPAIIGDTIERGVRRRLQRLLAIFGADSRVGRGLLAAARSLAGLLGSNEDLARDAQAALEKLGGLSRREVAKRLVGYDDAASEHRLMLLAMGPDMTSGVLHVADGKVTADLDLFHLAPRYLDEELAMRDVARVLGGELRVNPAWSFLGKPVTVHGQGGCRLSDTPELGVANPDGEVWNARGLYVLDGACLCSSVGSNPSATIAAIAERNVLQFIRTQGRPDWPEGDSGAGAELYRRHQQAAATWADNARARGWQLDPPRAALKKYASEPLGIAFDERMQGFHADLANANEAVQKAVSERNDATFRRLETLGRPEGRLALALTARSQNLQRFLEDFEHKLELEGSIELCLPADETLRTFPVKGALKLFKERRKSRFVLSEARAKAQRKIAGSYTSTGRRSSPEPEQRSMEYALRFTDHRGVVWNLAGYKRIKDDPGFDAWRDTTSLFVHLESGGVARSAGVVHVDLAGFMKQLGSLRVVAGERPGPADADPTRVAWTLATFARFFFGTLQRIYLPEAGVVIDTLFRPPRLEIEP